MENEFRNAHEDNQMHLLRQNAKRMEAEKADLAEALKSLANAAMAGQQHTIGSSAWYDECYPGQSYAGELHAALDAAHAVLTRLNPLPDLAAEVKNPYHTQTA